MVKLDDYQAVEEILSTEWGYEIQNTRILTKFCPVCQAKIPWIEEDKAVPMDAAVNVHKEYHLSMARLLSSAATWHTPIGGI